MSNVLGRGSLAAAIGALFASSAWAVPADFAAKADFYLKSSYPADGPGAAVIVVEHGKVVYEGGRGLANIRQKRKIDPGTVFRIGSITKQFTASVILQLEQEGKFALSDPLSKYLPDYPEPGRKATIAQLLNHTSGIKNYTEMGRWMLSAGRARPVTTSQLIDIFRNEPADFPPGTDWHYDNSGYILLGAIIEKVTGKPWYVSVEDRITKPLGLKTIQYGVHERSIAEMATGYSIAKGKVVDSRPVDMSNPHAAGSLVGSVEDFARWAQALHHGKVLGAADYARMITPTKLPDGTSVPYGFAQGLGEMRGHKAISHGGDVPGFSVSETYIPDDDLLVAVFANSDDPPVPSLIARAKLTAMALGEPYPEFHKVPLAESGVESLLGIYPVKGGERRLFMKNGRLYTRRTNANDEEVFAAGNDRFFYGPTTLAWFEIKRDSAGKHIMTMYQGAEQKPERSTRIGPIPADVAVNVPRSVLERYVGSYKSDRGVAAIALGDDNRLTIRVGSQQPLRLLPVDESHFRVESMDARITFESNAGSVTGLSFKQGGSEVHAERQPAG